MPEAHPLHAKNPALQTSPEVERSVAKRRRLKGEKTQNEPGARIEVYLKRLENLFLNKDEHTRERNVDILRRALHRKLVGRQEVVVDEMLKAEARIAREQGHGDIRITDDMRQRPETLRQAADIIERQEQSLDAWIDYLSSDDISYPPWFRYYVFTNVIGLQSLEKREKVDKQTGRKKTEAAYPKRNDRTLKPFPDIYRGKLAKIYDTYAEYLENGKKSDAEVEAYFKKSFPQVYAEESLDHIENAGKGERGETRGKWVKYRKGNEEDVKKLVASLQNKYTDWCTEGHGTARNQLMGGDFYVFYSYDGSGKAVNPRIAIRMQDREIGEMRGISGGRRQEVEDTMLDEADRKLNEFGPEADSYRKKSADMKLLTAIEKKTKAGEPLVKDELAFLYELNGRIEGFGYQRDPRVKELREMRNPKEDAPVVFGCTPEEIAWKQDEITQKTKAYVGALFPGVFNHELEHIYTSFPEGRILEMPLTIGGESPQEIEKKLKKAKTFETSSYAMSMVQNRDFTTLKNPEVIQLVTLSVADLGFPQGAKTREIHAQARLLGLELCPPETGPRLRLAYDQQPPGDYLVIGMKPITDSGGNPLVFSVYRDGDGRRWLGRGWVGPELEWRSYSRFVFRKLALSPSQS